MGASIYMDGNERIIFSKDTVQSSMGVKKYVQDVAGLGKYNWAEAVWWVLVESLDEMQQKLARGEVSNVQMSGFTLLIQVVYYKVT